MFVASKPRIKILSEQYPHSIALLESIFGEFRTGIYIDWANVRNWAETLGWHVDLERLKDLLDSFTPTKYVRFYWGTLPGAPKSKATIAQAERLGFVVRTKEVKRIRIAIDVLNISQDSPIVLKRFISRPLLNLLPLESIVRLNECLRALNESGTLHVENLKCNFDVEIGIDIRIDRTENSVENFLLWSGDSDFEDPVEQLLNEGKSVTVFATRGRIARELNALQGKGLRILDVHKLREFICWHRESRFPTK